jgi:8-oxo-dGTP pyrophosphatase MutT (NUDIX family)
LLRFAAPAWSKSARTQKIRPLKMKTYHPRTNDQGTAVELKQPHQPTALTAWGNPNQLATVTPDSPMPASVGDLVIAPWLEAPTSNEGWKQLAAAIAFDEPPLKPVLGRLPASGAVVVEPDGRVWVVSPSNRFGGYANTFPKGKNELAQALCLRANALKEVFEEAGLQVELTGFLCDSIRSTSVTRYYLARRLGGNPAEMCWESQAVHLVPAAQLAAFVSHPNDQSILAALKTQCFN